MSEILIPTNDYQTPITQELLDKYPKEVQDQLIQYINGSKYINNLISPNRQFARNLPRDANNKIIVDIMNPHILEDMDYFRPTAIHFLKTGRLTDYRPNSNPNSEYAIWLNEEIRRIWYGMVRESDGEWITGLMYFYLNYMPMEITESDEGGSNSGNRVTSFPRVWEGAYLWFHYLHQARYGGKYDHRGGNHAIQVATRGASKSYTCASICARSFVCGDNEINNTKTLSVIMAALKETLTKDGTLNKFEYCIDHCAKYTEFPNQRLTSTMNDMNWIMGYRLSNSTIKYGTENQTMGVTTNDNAEKARGKRVTYLIYEEIGAFPNFLTAWTTNDASVSDGKVTWGQMVGIGCVCKGTKVYNKQGIEINIEDITQDSGIIGFKDSKANIEPITYIQDELYKDCVEIVTKDGTLKCSIDHPILTRSVYRPRIDNNPNRRKRAYCLDFKEAQKLTHSDYIAIIDRIDIYDNYKLFDPYLVGMLIGDGSYGYDKTPVLSNCDSEVLNYVHSNYDTIVEKERLTKDNKKYQEVRIRNLCGKLREIGIYGQTKQDKRLPDNYEHLDYINTIELIAGLFDSYGCIYYTEKDMIINITQCNKPILEQIKKVLRKLGVFSNIYEIEPGNNPIDKNVYYELRIRDKRSLYNFVDQIPLKIKYKSENAKLIKEKCINKSLDSNIQYDNIRLSRILEVKSIGNKRIYNLTADDSNTYIANGIITHNTGGSKGSNFYGVMEMLYNPIGYQVYPLPNYYDLNSTGEGKTVFFFGAYFNREGFYNKDGVSDVVGTILDVLMKRYKIKYNSTDPARLTQSIAERPLTIQEAIMREDASIFPVAQLADVLNTLNTDPTIEQSYYKGRMKVVDGMPDFDPTADVREIDKFPHKDNKLDGCITIYQLPKRGVDNQVFTHRYIAGTDPVDDDGSQTMSLQSTFILDLFTDEIVAEYTGRPLFADDYFEQLRLLLLFYNAQDNYENNKKGLFGHFDKHNSLHLLTDQLPFLKDMDLVRFTGQGNKAKGYHATQGINGYANRLTRNWLLGSHTIYKKDEESDELIPIESQRLYTLKSKAFVEELIQWNTKGNYDRVSAFGALMLLREQRMIDYQGDVKSNVTEKISKNYLGNDDFFSKNFKNYKNSKFRKRPDDGMY